MGTYRRGKSIDIAFSDFAPDLALDSQGIILDAQGAMPTVKGYQAMNGALPHIYAPLPELPLGSTVARYSTGDTVHWAGGGDHLWRQSGTIDDPASVWVQADNQFLSTYEATKWRFAQFNDDLIAVGGAGVKPQVAVGPTGNFGNLGGNPPVGATLVLAVNSQVMLFVGNTWYVSADGGDNTWVTSLTDPTGTQVQSGFAPLTDFPGDVVAAQVLFRNVIAFKNTGIWFGSYVGSFDIWSFQLISDVNGTWCQEATMPIPEGIAFFGVDDFYLCTGYTPQRIKNNLKEWFFDTADATQFANMTSRYDPYHAVGYWHFVSKNPPVPGVPDRFIAYNFRAQRWAPGYLQTSCVPFPNYNFGEPSDLNGFYFDVNNVLQTFRGPPGAMRLLTGYMGMPGKKTQLMRVRPKYDFYPRYQALEAYNVDYLGAIDTPGPVGTLGRDGWFYLRQRARYHRVQLSVGGSTTAPTGVENNQNGAEVSGIAVEWRESGDR